MKENCVQYWQLLVLLFVAALLQYSAAQDSETTTSYGSDLYVGFMQNLGGFTFGTLRLTVGTPADGTVSFVIENSIGTIHTGTVTADEPMRVDIPNDHQVLNSDFDNREKGIHVYSTDGEPLYVVAENLISFLNHGAYLAYPCLSLGDDVGEYRYGVVSADDPTDELDSQVLLIGCEDNTTISITPSQSISLPADAQSPSESVTIESGALSHEVTLNQMQTLLVFSVDDLTGTTIISNKPLAVISGHECANIPLSEAGCEPLAVQVPPIATWGTQFLLAPFAGRDGPQAFKAVSSKDNTTFIYTCASGSRFAPGTKVLSFFSDSYCYLQSTDPIFVTQLSFGGSIDNRGDPAITMVSPIDQYVKEIDFVSLSTNDFPLNYISVTVAAEHYDPESILLDGEPINCNWEAINDTEDEVVGFGCDRTVSSNRNAPAKHMVSHSAEDGLLSVLVYGFNSFPGLGYSYLAGQVIQITEDDGGDIDFEINFLPLLDLTTFPGVLELDKTVADPTSDGIPIPDGLIFGNRIATLAYVNENGVISFNKQWKFSVPERFPTEYFWTRAGMAVAPFWSDNDIRKEGSVRYATYHTSEAATNPVGKDWLDQVNTYIQGTQAEEEELFEGNWVLTVHWENVHPSPHGEEDHRGISEEELERVNSYQTTIVSDVSRTYAVFSYMCGEVQWSSLGRNRAAVVGYNAEANFFENHPLSGLSGIGDAVSCTFDIGKRRKRQDDFLMPNNMPMPLPADDAVVELVQACLRDEARDQLSFMFTQETPESLAMMLEPCPCTIQQAVNDRARFVKLDQPSDCYVSSTPRNFILPTLGRIALTQMCCYDNTNGALQVSPNEGFAGTMLLFHPIYNEMEYQMQYQQTDADFRSACCEIGFDDRYYCNKYFEQRIINDCTGYEAPVLGYGAGDPHYLTFDARYYDFQGSGQYILLRILPENGDTDSSIFTLQGEMDFVNQLGVSVHNILAFGRPGLSFRFERGFRVYQTQPQHVEITNQLQIGQPVQFGDGRAELTRVDAQNLLVNFFESGVTLELYAGFWHSQNTDYLNFEAFIPRTYERRTQGFLGNLDTNPNNEYHTRDNNPVPNLNSDQQIFPHLENNWKLTGNDESFFAPSKRKRQVDQEFTPVFFDDLNITDEVAMACEGNPQCIFDLTITGDMTVAMDTLNQDKETNMTRDIISNFPPNISADAVFEFTLGQESAYTLIVSDPGDEFTLTVLGGLPPNSALEEIGEGEYVFRWNLQEVTTEPLTFVANDSMGASSTYIPIVEICACANGGNCTRDGLLSSNATVVLNCVCSEAFSGIFCEEDRNGCSEIQCFEGVECMDVPAPGVGAVCGSCPDGYTGDAAKCYDIDECLMDEALCDQICENTDGSFACACFDGYQLTEGGNQCQDINECDGVNDCQQLCENTEGSYSCDCVDGFTLDDDGRNCTADVPCEGACSYECAVINGEEQCYCPTGFELSMPGGTQCVDINECDQSPCDQLCFNTEGSFQCSCQDGYQLQDNGQDCIDIDECLEAALRSVDLCADVPNSQCVNDQGSFMCVCVPGYELVNETCSRIINEPPPPPPPVVTPTSGAENSINYTAPNLTPGTFTPALQQKFRDITSNAINVLCEDITCDVVLPNGDIDEVSKLSVDPVNVAIPVSLIGQNELGQLRFTVYVQLSDSFLSKEHLQLAVQQSEEQYREAGFLVPFTEAPTTEVPTTEAPTTEVPTTEAPTTEVPTTEAPTTEVPTTEATTTEVPTTEAPTTEVPTTVAPTTEEPISCPPECNPEYCSNFLTRRSPCTIPTPASSDCSSACRITFCHTCYYADEDRPLPGNCDTCPYFPLVSHVNEKCFKSWAVCVRRANGALYTKAHGKAERTPDRFRCYEHPCVKAD